MNQIKLLADENIPLNVCKTLLSNNIDIISTLISQILGQTSRPHPILPLIGHRCQAKITKWVFQKGNISIKLIYE
jgi:hypothetical protein